MLTLKHTGVGRVVEVEGSRRGREGDLAQDPGVSDGQAGRRNQSWTRCPVFFPSTLCGFLEP